MASCKDCIHYEVCGSLGMEVYRWGRKPTLQIFLDKYKAEHCTRFKTRSRFVELNIAKKIKHTPDIDKMREFHKLGLGKGMSERSIFWTCSNCKVWVSLAHKFCPNCGAKFEAEQMAEKLKPCPFCGGNAEHYVGHSISNDTTLPHEIRCKDIFGCGACIRESISPYSKDYEKQVENLYDRWNTRQTLKEREENA